MGYAIAMARLLAGAVVGGLGLYAGWPRTRGVRLTYDAADNVEASRVRSTAAHNVVPLNPAPGPVNEEPLFRIIHLKVNESSEARIVINTRTGLIDRSMTTSWLFGRERLGSAGAGMAVIAAVPALFTWMILFGASRYWQHVEDMEGMSRYAVVILDELEGQLPPDTEDLLRTALKRTWEFEKRRRKISFEEARDLLRTLKIHVYDVSGVDTPGIDDVFPQAFRQLVWYADADQTELIAQGTIANLDTDEVQVFGSTFTDRDARALAACFRTSTVEVVTGI